MPEPTDTSPRKRRLLLVVGALAAAVAIGGAVVAAVDDDGDRAEEEVGGDTNGDALEFGSDQDGGSKRDDGPNISRILESPDPVRRARKQGIPIIKITPKQARAGRDAPPKVQRLLEEKLAEKLKDNGE